MHKIYGTKKTLSGYYLNECLQYDSVTENRIHLKGTKKKKSKGEIQLQILDTSIQVPKCTWLTMSEVFKL